MTSARTFTLRPLSLSASAALLVIGGALAATPALADDHHGHGYRYHGHDRHHAVPRVSLNIHSQPYYAPAPVYYAPAPAYYPPQPVYYAPSPTYYAPPYIYYGASYYPPRRHVSTNFNFTWR